MKRLMIIGWAVAAICLADGARAEEAEFVEGQWVTAAEAGDDSAAGELALIRQLLVEDRPKKALGKAKRFLKDYPGDRGGEEAMNLAGQAQIERGRLWKAYKWYEQQLDDYPTGPLYERALVREASIGEAFVTGTKQRVWGFLRMDATDEGLDILQRVADRLPGSALAERCLMQAGDALAANKQWAEAAMVYQQYGERFRGRYRSMEAELKAAQTTHNQFSGTLWDDTALLEAEQMYRAFLARYPTSEPAGEVAAVLTGIEQDRARKEYETARFYERIGRPQAAAVYDRQVVALYPATTWATQSAQALNQAAEEDNSE